MDFTQKEKFDMRQRIEFDNLRYELNLSEKQIDYISQLHQDLSSEIMEKENNLFEQIEQVSDDLALVNDRLVEKTEELRRVKEELSEYKGAEKSNDHINYIS